MTKTITTATTTQLAHISGLAASSIEPILTQAGVVPVSAKAGKNGVRRVWPRVAALKALRTSEQSVIKQYRDQIAASKARTLEIREGIRNGSLVTLEAHLAAIERLMNGLNFAIRHFPRRHANDFATAAAHSTTDIERREAIRTAIGPTFAAVFALFTRSN